VRETTDSVGLQKALTVSGRRCRSPEGAVGLQKALLRRFPPPSSHLSLHLNAQSNNRKGGGGVKS